MNVSYGYTHSTFKKYDGGTTSSEEQIDYSGNYVPFVPRHTMNAGANYSFFFDKKQLDAKPDFRHELYRSRKNLLD